MKAVIITIVNNPCGSNSVHLLLMLCLYFSSFPENGLSYYLVEFGVYSPLGLNHIGKAFTDGNK